VLAQETVLGRGSRRSGIVCDYLRLHCARHEAFAKIQRCKTGLDWIPPVPEDDVESYRLSDDECSSYPVS
jgi:hypothetical protein